jgi:hypothetical protein
MPASSLTVAQAANYLVNKKKIKIEVINIRTIVLIRALENEDRDIGQNCNTKDLKQLSYEDIAKGFLTHVVSIPEEDLTDEKIAEAQMAVADPDKINESELEKFQDLLKAKNMIEGCRVIDQMVSANQAPEAIKLLADAILESPFEHPCLYVSSGKVVRFGEKMPEVLKNSKDLFSELVKQNCDLLRYASDELKSDKAMLLLAMGYDVRVFDLVPKDFWSNEEFTLAALDKDVRCLQELPDDLPNYRMLVEHAVKKYPKSLQFASDAMRLDAGILEIAKKSELKFEFLASFKKLSEEVQIAKDFLQKLALQYPSIAYHKQAIVDKLSSAIDLENSDLDCKAADMLGFFIIKVKEGQSHSSIDYDTFDSFLGVFMELIGQG